MKRKYLLFFLAIMFVAFAALAIHSFIPGNPQSLLGVLEESQGNALGVNYVNAYPNLSFKRPLDIKQAPGDHGHMYVVEQRGIIYRFRHDSEVDEKPVFLDIRQQVDDDTNEEGLLGLAFHPDFEENGYFFLNYTIENPNLTRISRFQIDLNSPSVANPASETIILTYEQPYWNHNGGGLAFGPDGYLYIGVGDGGSGGDPQGNGQNPGSLLGTILRIDIDRSENGKPYAIPSDNPFADNDKGYHSEIFAYGLRNPWRIHFDSETGELWTGDVGQNQYEEIDIITNGGNYGWNEMEATHCYNSRNCEAGAYIAPVWEYSHSQGSSITGGFVYRGNSLPELQGRYIYADFVSHRLWALDQIASGTPRNIQLFKSRDLQVSSFGADHDQELYICSFDGNIYKLTSE